MREGLPKLLKMMDASLRVESLLEPREFDKSGPMQAVATALTWKVLLPRMP